MPSASLTAPPGARVSIVCQHISTSDIHTSALVTSLACPRRRCRSASTGQPGAALPPAGRAAERGDHRRRAPAGRPVRERDRDRRAARPVAPDGAPGHPGAGRPGPAAAPARARHDGREPAGAPQGRADQPLRRPRREGRRRPAPRCCPRDRRRRARGGGARACRRTPAAGLDRLRYAGDTAAGDPAQLAAAGLSSDSPARTSSTTGSTPCSATAGSGPSVAHQRIGARQPTAAERRHLETSRLAAGADDDPTRLRRRPACRSSTATTATAPTSTPSTWPSSTTDAPWVRAARAGRPTAGRSMSWINVRSRPPWRPEPHIDRQQ